MIEPEKTALQVKESSAGKSLKRIFRQDEALKKIENQPASISMLMNPIRLAIFLHLCSKPCDHTRSIARSIDLSPSVVNWHLSLLHEKGYIGSEKFKGTRVYWPTGMVMQGDINAIKTLRNKWAVDIIRSVSEIEGGARQKDIVKKIKAVQQNVNVWVGTLVSVDLLEKNSIGRRTRYAISPNLMVKMADYDYATKSFSSDILSLFHNDGLMPINARLRGPRLSVTVRLPSGNRRLHIQCNPLAPLRKIMKK